MCNRNLARHAIIHKMKGWKLNAAVLFLCLLFQPALEAAEKFTGWVSEENCKEQHTKQGGKDCVKKCLRGGAHVGHPEWTPQKMMFIEEGSKAAWMVANPETLKGYEGERVSVNAESHAEEKTLRIEKVFPYREPVHSTLFELRNGFWINLHHFLRGTARRELHPESKPKVEFVVTLSDEEKESWKEGVEYYKTHFAEKDLIFNSEIWAVKNWFADAGNETVLRDGPDPKLKEILMKAAPVYRKHWWPEHQRANQEWILVAQRLLDQFGNRIAKRLETAYGKKWQRLPADVTVEAGWSGAYTTGNPVHITIASTETKIQDYAALETLFHEASHGWGRWIQEETEKIAAKKEQSLPKDFWHALIFHTAGEITSNELEQVGIRDYIPYAELNKLYDRGWTSARCALEKSWKMHVLNGNQDTQKALDEAIADLKACEN